MSTGDRASRRPESSGDPAPPAHGQPVGEHHVAGMVAAFEQNPDPLLVVEGSRLEVVAASKSLRLLVNDRPLLGHRLEDVLSEALGREWVGEFLETFRTGLPRAGHEWRVQLDVGRGHRRELFLDFALVPWVDEGVVRGVIARIVDATDRVHERRTSRLLGHLPLPASGQLSPCDAVQLVQDSMLPEDLPVLPGLDLAASYLLAPDEEAAGGDWFEAVVRPDATVALVVGDVVGGGVDASSRMGRLRAVLHERLASGESVAQALTAADRFARGHLETRAATVCVVLLHPDTGELAYCTAGHPPPLVVAATGRTRFLEPSGSAPLGTGSAITVAGDRLEEDELVLLYTDGIIERPAATPTQGTVDLARVTSAQTMQTGFRAGVPMRPVERVCELGLELLVRKSGYVDDIAMLAAQRVPRITPMVLRLPGDGTALGTVHDEVARWLEAVGVRALDEVAIQHATGELVTNALEHAYDGGASPDVGVVLEADVDATGHLVCAVTDSGSWRQASPDDGRGRGLAMVRGLVDELELHRRSTGTTALLRHRLTRPAQLLTSTTGSAGPTPTPEQEFDMRMVGGRVVVSGPVDSRHSDALRSTLQHVSRGSSADVEVDLAGVTLLGSAAVAVLHELSGEARSHLRLLAPPGTVAQRVLDLVRLPYESHRPGMETLP